MPDMSEIYDLLLGGDPAAAQKRQAALLRGKQDFQDVVSQGSDQAHGLDLLNFVAGAGSNNPMLARSLAALQASRQAQYAPQKLDKGVYVPATGQYVESPGVADEKEADRESRRLQMISILAARDQAAQQAADARKYAADQAREGRVLAATLAAQARGAMTEAQAARLELQRDRLANTVNQQNQADVRAFGKDLKKNGIPDIAEAVSGVNDLLAKPPGEIKGIGYGQEALSEIPVLSDITMGSEGKANRATVQKLINALTATEAGKAVTKNELVRQALVNMAGNRYNEKDFRNAMTKVVLPALETIRSNVLHSADPTIVDQYVKNDDSGFDPRKSFLPGKGVFAGGEATPPSIDPLVSPPGPRHPVPKSPVDDLLDKYAPKKQ